MHPIQTGRFAVLGLLWLASWSAQAQTAGLDVGVTQTLSGTPAAGSTVSVRITLSNTGTLPSSAITVTGGVANAALNTISGAGSSCAKGRNSVYTCITSPIAPGASVTLGLSARIDNNAATFTSNVTAQLNDVDFSNNRSSLSVAVVAAPPDLQLGGSSDKSPRAGTQYSYTFQTKVNSQPATGVRFLAALPPELSLVSVGSSIGAACTIDAAGAIDCPLGDLPVGGGATVTVTVLAPATVGTSYSFTGAVSQADGRDANLSNNTITLPATTR